MTCLRSARKIVSRAVMMLALAVAPVLVGAGPASSQTAPSVAVCAEPTSYLVVNGQLYSGTMTNGNFSYTPIGAAVLPSVNALAYNYNDGYLYAFQGDQVVRIDPNTGAVTVLGPTNPRLPGPFVGTFDAAGIYTVISEGNLVRINLNTLEATITPLSQQPGLADFTLAAAGGFLYGASPNGIAQVNPTTGEVRIFPLPAGMEGLTGSGGAFTFANGDIGFVQNNPLVIYRVRVTDAGSASPTFTLVGTQALPFGPAASLDAASCVPPSNAICLSPPPTSLAGYNVIRVQAGVDTVGTAGPDLIIGSEGPDRIAALGGNDIIFGMGGDDRISAGAGDDIICAGTGNDWVPATLATTSSPATPATTTCRAATGTTSCSGARAPTGSPATPTPTRATWVGPTRGASPPCPAARSWSEPLPVAPRRTVEPAGGHAGRFGASATFAGLPP